MESPIDEVTGQIIARHRCSKRIAFYDMDIALPAKGSSAPNRNSCSQIPSSKRIRLVTKSGDASAFEDHEALAVAQKTTLKLGNIITVKGVWESVRSPSEWPRLKCTEIVDVVEQWAAAHPGVAFQRPAAPAHTTAFASADTSAAPSTADAPEPAPIASVCKFFATTGKCHKGDTCKYRHDKTLSSRWVAARQTGRRALAAQRGDPHGDTVGKKSARAATFVAWLVAKFGAKTLSAGAGVLDVAGGRGDVAFELHTKRGIRTYLVEPRARKLSRAQWKWLKQHTPAEGPGSTAPPNLCEHRQMEFTPDTWHAFTECAAVVGMHPDQATEAIVDFAVMHNKPFAVVPCCVFPALFPYRRDRAGQLVTTTQQLVEYIQDKTGGTVEYLDMEGANQVVFRTATQ
eukprot:m.256090 g.256090  ORF g.256090 m.256090 type:complete len:401 (+) comp19626_c0_seq1:389-1591(+)